MKVKVTQSCRTLCDPMVYTVPGQNTGTGSLSFRQGDLSNLGIEPRSPALQVDSLPAESPGKLEATQRQWRTGRPGMLQFMGSQRVGSDWETAQQLQQILRDKRWVLPLGRVTPWTAAPQAANSLLIYSLTQKSSLGCVRHLGDMKPNKTESLFSVMS